MGWRSWSASHPLAMTAAHATAQTRAVSDANNARSLLFAHSPLMWVAAHADCFGMDISTAIIKRQIDAIADKSRMVNGKPTSLLELGFEYVGLDDGWMKCNSGPGGQGYHDADGNPIVDDSKFPGGLAPLNQYGRSKGAKMGWYLSACGCPDEQIDPTQKRYRGDVKALIDWGFDAVKIDGGGNQHNDSYFVQLLNETVRPILQLYSFSGPITTTECPNNYHGVSGDIQNNWPAIARCLHAMPKWLTWDAPLSRPGCWAFPDSTCIDPTCAYLFDARF